MTKQTQALMYTLKHRAASTTSIESDNEDDFDRQIHQFSPAQWSAKRLPSRPRPKQIFSPICKLPPEMLIHVFKHLHSPRDLHSCTRVSRTWCECAVELLWHKPSLAKQDTLHKLVSLLTAPDQTFTYASFIRRLNFLLLSKDITDDLLRVFAACDRLERLTLVNCFAISGETLTRVLPNFASLVAIDLNGVLNTTNNAIVGLATSAKRLQGINLSGCFAVSDEGVMALATNCHFLRRVKLSGLSLLTDQPVCALAQSCPLLLEIDLNHCQLITDVAVREIWLHSSHMREMRLSHCPELTDAAFPAPIRKDAPPPSDLPNPFANNSNSEELTPLVLKRPFEHLRMLDLTACSQVTDEAVEGIVQHAPKIRNLVLSKCGLLTDRSVENICRLGRHLHYLHLGHASKITDRSVRTLARSCTRLRYVDFANCVLLTDMSVFELASLPKLRRVGLVRVNNLTDEAIYALAERHATLERIHLSYCDQISVMAIHFLLQKLHKLTHLSLTGVPAFRQPELQRFCRDPPPDFNPTQQLAFCVYSGKGVSQLRAFLTELFDHITEMNGTDDTEYDEEDDCDAFQEDDIAEPDFAGEVDEDEDYRRTPGYRWQRPLELESLVSRDHVPRSSILPIPTLNNGSTAANLQTAASRLHILASNSAVGSSRRSRPPQPRSLADILPIVENSHSPPLSDVASNRSVGSNGATFFRTYQDGPTRNSGALTPDLNFAEIGHGRGAVAGPSVHPLRRSHEQVIPHRPPFIEIEPNDTLSPQPSTSQIPSTANIHGESVTSAESHGVVWPYREPASPTVFVSPAYDVRQRIPSDHTDSRGRSVKKSLRNTLNAAEHFLFRRSPTRGGGNEDAGPSSRTR